MGLVAVLPDGEYFRGFNLSAPLKQVGNAEGRYREFSFPRVQSLGPIEAELRRGHVGLNGDYFRGFNLSAPLKHSCPLIPSLVSSFPRVQSLGPIEA